MGRGRGVRGEGAVARGAARSCRGGGRKKHGAPALQIQCGDSGTPRRVEARLVCRVARLGCFGANGVVRRRAGVVRAVDHRGEHDAQQRARNDVRGVVAVVHRAGDRAVETGKHGEEES